MDKQLHAIILAGGTDFGRCAIGSKVPACLWPVLGRPAIVRVLDWLAANGISSATICFNSDISILKTAISSYETIIKPEYLAETLPWGTAGCTREAIKLHGSHADHYLICKSNMLTPPPLAGFIEHHIESGDLLSLSVNVASSLKNDTYEATGIFLCKPELLEHIPKLGYCDIKERLIPCLVQKDIEINSYFLGQHIGSFRDIKTYFKTTCMLLSNNLLKHLIPSDYIERGQDVFVSPKAKIASTARIFGPLIILDDAEVSDNSIIFGPGIIANKSYIGPESFLEASQVWPEVRIEKRSQIRHSFINSGTRISARSKIFKEVIY